jgi:hypothetical protein
MNESLDAQAMSRGDGAPDSARLLGPGDVARWLGVSAGWVRDHAMRKQPRIKAVKIGKRLRFKAEDVEDLIRARSE